MASDSASFVTDAYKDINFRGTHIHGLCFPHGWTSGALQVKLASVLKAFCCIHQENLLAAPGRVFLSVAPASLLVRHPGLTFSGTARRPLSVHPGHA